MSIFSKKNNLLTSSSNSTKKNDKKRPILILLLLPPFFSFVKLFLSFLPLLSVVNLIFYWKQKKNLWSKLLLFFIKKSCSPQHTPTWCSQNALSVRIIIFLSFFPLLWSDQKTHTHTPPPLNPCSPRKIGFRIFLNCLMSLINIMEYKAETKPSPPLLFFLKSLYELELIFIVNYTNTET